jgi:hypothetical protein
MYRIERLSWRLGLYTLQRQNTEISKQIFPEKEYRGLSPNFHIHAPVMIECDPTISDAGLMCPRPMCPRPKVLGCCVP